MGEVPRDGRSPGHLLSPWEKSRSCLHAVGEVPVLPACHEYSKKEKSPQRLGETPSTDMVSGYTFGLAKQSNHLYICTYVLEIVQEVMEVNHTVEWYGFDAPPFLHG